MKNRTRQWGWNQKVKDEKYCDGRMREPDKYLTPGDKGSREIEDDYKEIRSGKWKNDTVIKQKK